MLTIEVKINGRTIAMARAVNVSDLADVSDYLVGITEAAFPIAEHTGLYLYDKITYPTAPQKSACSLSTNC